jgi:hypothetical protein
MGISVLKEAMSDHEDWIDYFIYETNYGDLWDDGMVYVDDEPIAAIRTPEALYDLLCQLYAKDMDESERLDG